MNSWSRLVIAVLLALSISGSSATGISERKCPAMPKVEIVSAIAPATGAYPVWIVDGSYGRWHGPEAPVKTAWILARDNPGDMKVEARKLESDDVALFSAIGSTEQADMLVIANADHPRTIPGGADPNTLQSYSFRSSAVVYPSAGCWEFLVTYGESRSSIIIELAED